VGRWKEVEVFLQTADLGALSRAAETLDISTSAASRHLASLERRLGARLFQRTTRSLGLTEAGQRYYGYAREALQQIKEAEASVREVVLRPSGLLRVSASLSFCLNHISPLLPAFLARYPDLTVDLVASNRYYDIIENGVDVAIRTRRVENDSSITIRRIAQTRRLLAASPAYIARYGMPTHPRELVRHQMLVYTLADTPETLNFSRNAEHATVTIKPLLQANDGQIIRVAAMDGLGILMQPTYIIHADLQAGRLVRVLDDWDLPQLKINLAFPTRVHLPAKVRVFIDCLSEDFRAKGYDRIWRL